LAHASRLAIVGELVASIAHEINQPLMSIESNAGAGLLLLDGTPGRDPGGELLAILRDVGGQARRAADVIERLRALVRKRPVEPGVLDVNDVVTDVLRLVEGDARRRGVTLAAELAPALPAIAADRVSLQQVVLNLIVNAMDAMDQIAAEERRLSVRTHPQAAGVEVAVSDRGGGIPPERLPRVFDAFFTTKSEGLGLGLAIARSIVEAHRGRIWAEDDGGRGATFHVTLPMPESAAN
jgi:C4-dicarboxylate-specific signal transduction histidine kinase